MDGIIFLTLDDVLHIHADQISRYGGHDGILDLRLIESAIAQPEAEFGGQFLHEDIAAMAAAYLFHFAKNHGFEHGNKRVGATAAMVFMEMNDVQIMQFPEGELAKLTLDVVTDVLTKDQAADMIRQRIIV